MSCIKVLPLCDIRGSRLGVRRSFYQGSWRGSGTGPSVGVGVTGPGLCALQRQFREALSFSLLRRRGVFTGTPPNKPRSDAPSVYFLVVCALSTPLIQEKTKQTIIQNGGTRNGSLGIL